MTVSRNRLITREQVEEMLNKIEPIGDNGTRLKIKSLEPYQKAFIHKSFALSPDPSINYISTESNERLEFLGDKVLGFVVASYLYKRYPDEQEGFLTKISSRIVRSSMLYRLARFLQLGDYILLSTNMEKLTFISPKKGRNSPWLYEDTFESFCGAIVEDFGDEDGFKYAKRFITSIIEHEIDFAELILQNENHKDTLQRYFQRLHWPNPVYEDLSQFGPFHSRTFVSGVFITREQLSLLSPSVQHTVYKFHASTLASVSQTVNEAINAFTQHYDVVILGLGTVGKKLDAQQLAAKLALDHLEIEYNWN